MVDLHFHTSTKEKLEQYTQEYEAHRCAIPERWHFATFKEYDAACDVFIATCDWYLERIGYLARKLAYQERVS